MDSKTLKKEIKKLLEEATKSKLIKSDLYKDVNLMTLSDSKTHRKSLEETKFKLQNIIDNDEVVKVKRIKSYAPKTGLERIEVSANEKKILEGLKERNIGNEYNIKNIQDVIARKVLFRDVNMKSLHGKKLNEIVYTLPEPLNLTRQKTEINVIIKSKFRDLMKQYNGHSYFTCRLTLKFKNVEGFSYTQFRKLFNASFYRNPEPVYNAIVSNVDRVERMAHPTPDYTVDVIGFSILQIKLPMKGGCNNRKSTRTATVAINGSYSEVVDVCSDGNNCAINCLKHITDNKERADVIRKKLGLVPNTHITIDQLAVLSDYFKVRINVLDFMGKHLKSIGEYAEGCTLLLTHKDGTGHYRIVKNTVDQIKCASCGALYGVYQKNHFCNPNKMKYYTKQKMGYEIVLQSKKCSRTENMDYDNMIYFDLETFINDKGIATPYACGWHNTDYQVRYGEGCMNEFIEMLGKETNKVVCAYNGSRFDFYFLLNEFIKRDIEVRDFLINNGRLMGFSWGGTSFTDEHGDVYVKGGNKILDLCQFIMSSLDSACKDFSIVNAKSSFDHERVKSFSDAEECKGDVLPYLQLDVMALKELFEKFQDMMFNTFKVWITDFMTLSSLAYAYWSTTVDVPIELVTKDKYDFIRKSIYGGRTYPMQTSYKSKYYDDIMAHKDDKEYLKKMHSDIDDYIFNGDITSLYPTAMKFNSYPIGKSEWVDGGAVNVNKLKVGIYEIEFQANKDILVPVLPRHNDIGGCEWSVRDGSGVYCSVDIENAIKYGYKVKVIKGLVWDEVSPVFEKYIDITYKIKEENDDNPVLRQIGKLLLNALYGKMLQSAQFNQRTLCNTYEDVLKFINDNDVNDYYFIGSKIVMVGETRDEFTNGKITKPSQLGAFVLGYSRRVMLDTFSVIDPELKSHIFTYTDTDSLHISNDKLPLLDAKGLLKKGLGKVSNDCKKDGKIIFERNLAPKMYMYVYINSDGEVKTTLKAKGIPSKYLEEQFYIENVAQTVHIENPFKRVNFKKIDIKEDGAVKTSKDDIDHFSIVRQDMDRTFNKNAWAGMELKDGKYYPFK